MKASKSNKTLISKKTLLIVAIALTALLSLFILEKTKVTNFIKLPNSVSESKTTSAAPSAQSSFNQGGDRSPVQSSADEGQVTDNRGSISSVPPSDQWTVSQGGVISVYNPSKNSVLKSGDTLSGKSTASSISFRLVDNKIGVIARGEIGVNNGNFAGTFSFSTEATEGRLDIFTADSEGVESNNIRIPLRFKD